MSKPQCTYCPDRADYVAEQSEDRGKTVLLVFICSVHASGWNDGGDWDAAVYKLGRKLT